MKTLLRSAAGAALVAGLSLYAGDGGGRLDVVEGVSVPHVAPAGLIFVELPTEPPAAAVALPLASLDPTPPGAVAAQDAAPLPAVPPPLSLFDRVRFSAAAALYRKGAEGAAAAIAASVPDPAQRAALEWIALRSVAAPDPARLDAFEAAHTDWPAADWLDAVREGWLFAQHASAKRIETAQAQHSPRTAVGILAAARAETAEGKVAEATKRVRALWREHDLDAWNEGALLKEFGALLTRADHKYRADRLLYAEKAASALRAAALAGADEVALANARFEAARGPLSPRAIAAVPASLQSDPGLTFARVQDARRAGRAVEAAAWLALAPRDAAGLIDPDKWWSERRMVARELLDRGAARQAYDLCSTAIAASAAARVDASFHAGWIALRFLDDPVSAASRFAEASAAAQTPLSIARASYWQGRAADVLGRADEAHGFYARAAAYPIAYYGQLAARRLGREPTPRRPPRIAVGDQRQEATRAIEILYETGFDDIATPLAYSAAANWSDEAQIAALGDVLARRANATVNVTFGKRATERGFALDEVAFPTTGLPNFSPLPHSADVPSVLAVARQESEFAWRASSGAGAKGLMQILPATAQSTARRAGVAFDFSRLVGDSAFNLQLGAAYLGQLIEDEGGSIEVALAAYNAGPGRVQQWIAAYGDPRTGGADPIDWAERIPFDETRDYVQRVSENLGVYRALLASGAPAPATNMRLARE